MAVCNLFNELENNSGNFLMFSQYVEDLTRHNTNGDDWKIVPSKFIALNIDYSKLDKYFTIANLTETVNNDTNSEIEVEPAEVETTENMNIELPKLFQNYYENACAFCKIATNDKGEKLIKEWKPIYAKHLFWYTMFNSNLLTEVSEADSETKYVKEIVYSGDINMHSYNTHDGMGYGEIYCYIPANATKNSHQVLNTTNTDLIVNTGNYLAGFTTDEYLIGDYSKNYYYNETYRIDLATKKEFTDDIYTFNTIVVLYSIYTKTNDEWLLIADNIDIPMGIYLTGKFNDTELSNTVTKHVTTSLDSGTSYGLRICTRFSATANAGKILTDTNTVSDTNYNNICQLMTKMNENLSRMFEVTKSSISNTQGYKDLLSIIKNNRTNVPYVKTINNKDYWFVNGRLVSSNLSSNDLTT